MKEWLTKFSDWGVLWTHDGNPKRPHAELTSGKHSDGFFNGSLLLAYPERVRSAARSLCLELDLALNDGTVDVVIGSAMGAVTLAHEVNFNFRYGRLPNPYVRCGFTEPQLDKSMLLKRFEIKPGERVLVVEDVLTTGGTTESTIQAIESAGGVVLPIIGVLFNRSGKETLGERGIIALVSKELSAWEPADCPLCKAGSLAVRPKANWGALTAEY